MNNEFVKVLIEWVDKKNKIMDLTSEGFKFYPQIKFEDEFSSLPQWTAEIVIYNNNNMTKCHGKLKYLSENAPYEYLKSGNKFSLFDGPNCIALGEVLQDYL